MKTFSEYDQHGTHFNWSLEGVTARMIDWFWSNLDKGFILWHPEQHEPLEWPLPPRDGNLLGAISNAPQTWDDGRRQNLYCRYEALQDVAAHSRDLICHEHVIIVAGLGFNQEDMAAGSPMGYRLHQWTASDAGVVGRSSAISGRLVEDEQAGKVWAAHAAQEIANWQVFLPSLYGLYKPVQAGSRNPFSDLSVQGQGRDARYRHLP